jgi:hypothetical protein
MPACTGLLDAQHVAERTADIRHEADPGSAAGTAKRAL